MFRPQLDIESEVNNEMANRMSLFYAEATPMLKTLSNATTNFVTEVRRVWQTQGQKPVCLFLLTESLSLFLKRSTHTRNDQVAFVICRIRICRWRTPRTVSAPWPVSVKSCWRHRESSFLLNSLLDKQRAALGSSFPLRCESKTGCIVVKSGTNKQHVFGNDGQLW